MTRLETGRCFCGMINAEMSGEPFWVCYDHDDDCRRAIGGPLMIWIGYRTNQVRYKQGQPATFSKTPGVIRSFCAKCGSSISYLDQGLAGEIYICIGFMDSPERFVPAAHGYWRERLSYLRINDDLPKQDGYTRPRDGAFGNPRDR